MKYLPAVLERPDIHFSKTALAEHTKFGRNFSNVRIALTHKKTKNHYREEKFTYF